MHNQLLAPLMALVLWTFVMSAWLYATRIPAILKARLVYDPQKPSSDFMQQIPAAVRWKADNYNNLMEQPTLFYAVVLALALLGGGDATNVALAWVYVGLRVAHSLVHALINVVNLRFALFAAGSIVLLTMTLRAAALVF